MFRLLSRLATLGFVAYVAWVIYLAIHLANSVRG